MSKADAAYGQHVTSTLFATEVSSSPRQAKVNLPPRSEISPRSLSKGPLSCSWTILVDMCQGPPSCTTATPIGSHAMPSGDWSGGQVPGRPTVFLHRFKKLPSQRPASVPTSPRDLPQVAMLSMHATGCPVRYRATRRAERRPRGGRAWLSDPKTGQASS